MFAEFMLPGQKFNGSFAYSDDLLFDPTSAISDDDGGRKTEVQSWKKTHINWLWAEKKEKGNQRFDKPVEGICWWTVQPLEWIKEDPPSTNA